MALINVPLATQSLGQTNADIRTNWTTINNTFAIDHVEFNAGADSGFHKKLTMQRQTTLPIAVTDPSILIYNALDAATARSEIYLKRQSDGVNLGIPITEMITAMGGSKGHTYFGSGILINWGVVSGTAGMATPSENFSKAFSGASTYSIVYSASTTGNNNIFTVRLSTQAAASVQWTPTTGSPSVAYVVNYIAIGLGA